jgi:hypothetical protein
MIQPDQRFNKKRVPMGGRSLQVLLPIRVAVTKPRTAAMTVFGDSFKLAYIVVLDKWMDRL